MTITTLPEPARGRRLPAGRASRRGSSRCRASGRSSRPGSRRYRCRRATSERSASWLDGGDAKVELEQAGEPVPDDLAAAVAEADARAVRRGCAAMLGLDEVGRRQRRRRADAARGPRVLPRDRHPARRAVGHVRDLRRGLCQPARPRQDRHRRPGRSPDVELKLAEDGELLMRSDVVMPGYRNQPDKTAEAIDADGWLHTGDIARDRRGRLRADRRPQEGDHHQRGRQEHVAGQHRVDAEGRRAADRPGLRDRRRAARTTRR